MRILVVSGASGGHIFPALAFLDALKQKQKYIDALLVLPEAHIAAGLDTSGYRLQYIPISPIKFSLDFASLVRIINFFKGSLKSMAIVSRFKPDVVVGFGSLTCIPVVMCAWLFRIKTLIHEQNVSPGKANRFLARFADRIAVSFEETTKHFGSYRRKLAITGNPMRCLDKIEKGKALDFFGFRPGKFTIMVMGGSQGSHSINAGFLRAAAALSLKYDLQIIHLTGKNDYDFLLNSYNKLNVAFKLFGFLKEVNYAYSASDIIISRAGASTLTELIYFSLPAVIIPYPYAYSHQLSNAKVLEEKGYARVILEEELSDNALQGIIESFLTDKSKLENMRLSYSAFPKNNAAEALAKETLSFA